MRYFIESRMAKTGRPYFEQREFSDSVAVRVADVEAPWVRSCVNPKGGFDTLLEARVTVNGLRLISSGLAIEYRISEAKE